MHVSFTTSQTHQNHCSLVLILVLRYIDQPHLELRVCSVCLTACYALYSKGQFCGYTSPTVEKSRLGQNKAATQYTHNQLHQQYFNHLGIWLPHHHSPTSTTPPTHRCDEQVRDEPGHEVPSDGPHLKHAVASGSRGF